MMNSSCGVKILILDKEGMNEEIFYEAVVSAPLSKAI